MCIGIFLVYHENTETSIEKFVIGYILKFQLLKFQYFKIFYIFSIFQYFSKVFFKELAHDQVSHQYGH